MEIEGFENYLIYEDGRVFNKSRNVFMKITDCTSKNSQVVNLTNIYGAQKTFSIRPLVGQYYTPKGGKPLVDPNYIVYPDGKVFSKYKGEFIALSPNRDGYITIRIGKFSNNRKSYTVHRLVAKAFLQNPDNLPFVDHKDRDKTNNNVDNLRWCCRRTNNCNRSKQKNNTSGYTGINQNEWGNWKASYSLLLDGKRIKKSKTFKTKEQAINFREEMVRLHYNRPN